jgi:hypothetical protein
MRVMRDFIEMVLFCLALAFFFGGIKVGSNVYGLNCGGCGPLQIERPAK